MDRGEEVAMNLLEVKGLGVCFGGVNALDGVDLSVQAGSVHGLIGPNGAGKTTLLNCVGRVIEPATGCIRMDGVDLLSRAPHELASLGIARTFQNLALMDDRSCLENVMVGIRSQLAPFGLAAFLPTPARRREDRASVQLALRALAHVGLEATAHQRVRDLPYGHRKSVEIARAICASPRLLMLDEPTAGLHPGEMEELARAVKQLHAELGLTVLLITHHIEFLLEVADAVTVLDLGKVIAAGPPELVKSDARVISAYLGTDEP
jgi:branched-chain amino acid transport system ATP-binding protein